MKAIKIVTTFLLLMTIGIFISYADVKYNNWTSDFIETFEETDASFKFYDIKINCVVKKDFSKDEVQKICIDIAKCLNLDEDKIKWNIKDKGDEVKIYAQIKNEVYNVSFAAIKKNNKEYYIIIDILSNKVYKNIVDIYQNLNNTLNKYTKDIEICTCIAGEYTKNLQLDKCNEILQNILYNMNAKEIDKVHEENFLSITAYSNLLAENDLEYFDNRINLNIGIRYSENEDKTLIYIATPIIKLDY
ncbi:MAG: YwmB family TATA-box binding protein [Peptostreptococcaceae bacterium]